jgi:hypothetical protein
MPHSHYVGYIFYRSQWRRNQVKKIASIISVCFLASAFMTSPAGLVLAQEGSRVYASEAQGKTDKPATITVSPYGMVISFIEVRESIEKFWTTDYSHLRIGSDTPSGKGAKLLFLKTEGEVNANTKGTSLTVITKTATGETNVYSFLIDFTTARPPYSIVRIYPDRNLRQTAVARSGTSKKPVTTSPPPAAQISQVSKSTAVTPAASQPIERPSSPPSEITPTDLKKPSINTATSKSETVPGQIITSSVVKSASTVSSSSPDAVPTKAADSSSPDAVPTKAADSSNTDAAPAKTTDVASSPDAVPAKTADSSNTDAVPAKTTDVASSPDTKVSGTDTSSPSTASSTQTAATPGNSQQTVGAQANVVPIETTQISKSSLTPTITSERSLSLTQANALVRGLAIANKKKEIGYTSPISRSVQNVVRRLRRGETLQPAAKQESIQWKTVLRLLQLGKYQGDV